MNSYSMSHLVSRAISWEEYERIRFADSLDFYICAHHLEQAGMTQRQLQLLIGKPFSAFSRNDCFCVVVMALALARGKATVAEWHEALREDEAWAKLDHRTSLFPTETLPSLDSIDKDLGIKPVGLKRQTPSLVPLEELRTLQPAAVPRVIYLKDLHSPMSEQ